MVDVDNKIKMIVEGLLLAAGKPLSLSVIAGVFSEDERPDKSELREVLDAIAQDCNDRGFELKEVASGFRFQVKQDVSEWIARLWEERPPRYSRALLETLALVAYRQPITRGDIEEIRGVGVSSTIMRTLIDREWVRVVGHKDVPGKPALYATTRQFLDYFNLKSIQELPPLSEIRELSKSGAEFDVEDDLATRNVLELPDEEAEVQTEVVNEEGEVLVFEAGELPDEDEAAELSRKPLDEILGIAEEGDTEQAGEDAEQDGEEGQSASADAYSEKGAEHPASAEPEESPAEADAAEQADDVEPQQAVEAEQFSGAATSDARDDDAIEEAAPEDLDRERPAEEQAAESDTAALQEARPVAQADDESAQHGDSIEERQPGQQPLPESPAQ